MKKDLDKAIFLITLLVFVVISVLTMLSYYFIDLPDVPTFLQLFVKYHIFFMFLIGIIGVVFGIYFQTISNRKIESNKEKIIKIKKLFLNSLKNEEKIVLNNLIKNNGISTQYEITSSSNLTKLRVSRVIDEMSKNKMISKQKVGKINKIYLSDDLKELFLQK